MLPHINLRYIYITDSSDSYVTAVQEHIIQFVYGCL